MAIIKLDIQLVIICLLCKSTVQCWSSSNNHNVRHNHHNHRSINNNVNKQLTNANNNQLMTNVNKNKPQQQFPCDNFICLLDKFELLKTESGFLLNKLNPSEKSRVKNNHQSGCADFKCWFDQFKVVPKSYGFEFSRQKIPSEISTSTTIITSAMPTTSSPKPSTTTIIPSSNSISFKNSNGQFLNGKDDQYYDFYDLLE